MALDAKKDHARDEGRVDLDDPTVQSVLKTVADRLGMDEQHLQRLMRGEMVPNEELRAHDVPRRTQ